MLTFAPVIDAEVTDGTRREMAYGWDMIKYLAATTPARTLRNADTIALFAACMTFPLPST